MTYREFFEAIRELAGGDYFIVDLTTISHNDGSILNEWSAYLDGAWTGAYATPEYALADARRMMGVEQGPPSTSAIPEAEAIETGDCDACDSTVPLDELTTIESSMGETTQCEECRSGVGR